MSTNSDQFLESLNDLDLQLRAGDTSPWRAIEAPSPVDGAVDLEAVRQRVQAGLDPLARFAR